MTDLVSGSEWAYEVQDVAFAYDDGAPAVDQVSLRVGRGERVAIVGANGCGKSTFLKILDGLYFPTQGTVRAFGRPLSERALQDDRFNFAFRRAVGLVFQDSDVQLFSPTVWDEVAFAPLQLGLSRGAASARVARALAALRIERLADRAPHRLSGGEKKRVALASVLSLDPAVWLMDEPTAGLDPRTQAWLIDFLVEQGRAGKTIVTATHDLDIVETIADRVYVFDEAHQVVAQGTPAEILADRELLVACNLAYDRPVPAFAGLAGLSLPV